MLEQIKNQLCELIRSLGYSCSDNGTYEEEFPYLLIRTGNQQAYRGRDFKNEYITIIVDVFSTYNGEKEIIDINSNILNHIQSLMDTNPEITAISQSSFLIIGDKKTGPVRKHGILKYDFITASSFLED